MTPEAAQALEPGTTPGPWTASECTGFIAAAEGERPVLTAERSDWWCEEDHRLAAAAPDMRATIAAQTWEWRREYRFTGQSDWKTQPWEQNPTMAKTHRPYLWFVDPKDVDYRLVRRLVGPVEVVEE